MRRSVASDGEEDQPPMRRARHSAEFPSAHSGFAGGDEDGSFDGSNDDEEDNLPLSQTDNMGPGSQVEEDYGRASPALVRAGRGGYHGGGGGGGGGGSSSRKPPLKFVGKEKSLHDRCGLWQTSVHKKFFLFCST